MLKNGRGRTVAIFVGAVVLLLAPQVLNTYLVHIGVFILINAIAVLGLGVLGGFAGQVSLGQAAFYGIGAYTSSLLATRLGVPFWLGMPTAVVVSAAAGLVIGVPTLRVAGLYLVMTTIGVNQIAWLVMMNWIPATGGPHGLLAIPAPTIGSFAFNGPTTYFYLALGFFLLFLFVTLRLVRSRQGLFFRALSDNELAASMVGVGTTNAKILAFVVSAAWAGGAGSLYAHYVGYIHPDNFTLDVSVLFLTMAIFGGGRSIAGMLIATVVLTGATEYLRSIGELRMVGYGLLLLLGMIYMPQGIGPFLPRIARYAGELFARRTAAGGALK